MLAPLCQILMTINSRCWASSKSSKEHGLATGDLLTRLLHSEFSSSRLAKVFSLSKNSLRLNLERVGKALTSWSVRRRVAEICSQVEQLFQIWKRKKYQQERKINWNKPWRNGGFESFSNARFEKKCSAMMMQQRDRLCGILNPVRC